MPKNLNNQQKDSLIPFFLLTFLITWGLGALAIFLPVQFQALVGGLTETSPIYFLAVAAPCAFFFARYLATGDDKQRFQAVRFYRWSALVALTGWLMSVMTRW